MFLFLFLNWLKFNKPWLRPSNEAVAADVFVERYAAGHTSSTLLQAISCEYSTLRLPSFGASGNGTCAGRKEALQSCKHSRCLCRSIGSCRLPSVERDVHSLEIKITPWRDAIVTPSFQVLCLASGSVWESWKYSIWPTELYTSKDTVAVLGKHEDCRGLAEISKILVGWNTLSSPILGTIPSIPSQLGEELVQIAVPEDVALLLGTAPAAFGPRFLGQSSAVLAS